MTKFERDKVYKTRNGKYDVRVLCIDAPGRWPIAGIYLNGDSLGGFAPRRLDGKYDDGTPDLDLMLPKPEPVVEWGYMLADKFECATSECGARHFAQIVAGARLAKRTTEIVE